MKGKVLFSARVCKIINYIDENFAKNVSLYEIVFRAANLSVSRAETIFKQEVGIPVKKFLIIKRLYEAGFLLRSDQKLSETDVLFCCGFDDVSNFIKQFKKHFGCTPKKFRNCNLNPETCVLRKKSYSYLSNNIKLAEALGRDVSQLCLLLRAKRRINSKKDKN